MLNVLYISVYLYAYVFMGEYDFFVFQISYTASCPCLSDRHQYPNFFRTMASDIYQTRAFAQLAIHFNWTWIGAVIADNDYGHVALKVVYLLQFYLCKKSSQLFDTNLKVLCFNVNFRYLRKRFRELRCVWHL